MMTATPESLANMATMGLTLEPPPTEEGIDEFLEKMANAYKAPADVIDQARKLIHARLAIRMEFGETLTSADEHSAWVDAARANTDPFFWSRYNSYLLKNDGWPPYVAATLDRATDGLLDLLGNPAVTRSWKRRGLVMGDVQSGKTATYSALICKAADAGYRMIILLTGTLENVRRQTQMRLDSGFIGFDSSDFLDNVVVRQKRKIGVGQIDGRRDAVVFTSRDHDFRKNAASALNISLNAVHEPVLVVTKKNKAVLERLAAWLRTRNADSRGLIDLPMLLIDDEADNASINTRQSPAEMTAINKGIRDLLGLFERSSYVGFTATPFANIFIDPSSTDAMLGDDLFPSDFIHVLKPPNNYIGMDQFFPVLDDRTDADTGPFATNVRDIEDADLWMPAKHGKALDPGPLPPSLRKALQCFLISCAVRDLRAKQNLPGRGGGLHRSMLVNVSRFTDVQNRVATAIHEELNVIRGEVRLHGALPPAEAERRSVEVAQLRDVFELEFGAVGQNWPSVLAAMFGAIAAIRVQAVNQSAGARSLDYASLAAKESGLRVIAVGGNSLSRGLTLEGLSSSYFLRNSKAYDTLLQMCRWFGYRFGYEDLCRLWLTEDAFCWYQLVAAATGELKRDFGRMGRRQATPREFGLRVRNHPGTLLITARNKMATGLDVVMKRDISLTGRGIESSRLYSDKRRNEQNASTLDSFFGRLRQEGSVPQPSPHGGALIWREVPARSVADMLDAFLVHPLNFDFQGDAIATFLRAHSEQGDPLGSWTVVLPTEGNGDAVVELAALEDLVVKAGSRKVKVRDDDGSLLVSGRSARVGGLSDLRHAFDLDLYSTLKADQTKTNEDDFRHAMAFPLLVIYLLRGNVGGNRKEGMPGQPYLNGALLPALGLHFPGATSPDSPSQLVHYRLNQVAQRQLLPEIDDDDDDITDASDDDD